MYEYIEKNVAEIRRRISDAAEKAGRDKREIMLLAASKTMPSEAVRAAIAAGVDVCGENRVQEMVAKLEDAAYEGAPLHFIGHLQTNKVKQVVGKVNLIHSVDSVRLMEQINRHADSLGIVQPILLEVNIGGELSKSGISPDKLDLLLESAGSFPALAVKGLMTIPPETENPAESLRYFAEMYNLYVDIKGKKYDNVSMDFLSMGMSADFEYAIAAGANIVRVGSNIFGPRDYSANK